MDTRKRTSLLILAMLLSAVVAHQSSAEQDDASASSSSVDSDLDNQESSNGPQIQRRSGLFHNSGLHYHLPATTGYAYAARPSYYTPVVKYPVYKTLAATPLYHKHHVHAYARPQYSLHHGGASVYSHNVNYPRYPYFRSVLKVPTTTVLKPTVFSAPGFVNPIAPVAPVAPVAPINPFVPQKPVIPIALNPVLPTAGSPVVYPQQTVFNPSILAGLNPQLIPISVSNGAVFTNYPTLAPTPIAPSAWKPIIPTVPTVNVQRPSISILPPLGGPSSTVATYSDSIHGHHQFAQHVPSTQASPIFSDSHDHHQHFLPSGK